MLNLVTISQTKLNKSFLVIDKKKIVFDVLSIVYIIKFLYNSDLFKNEMGQSI